VSRRVGITGRMFAESIRQHEIGKKNPGSGFISVGLATNIPESRRTYPYDFLFIDLKRQWSIVNLI
jgi:hypothetical protein